MTKIMKKIVSLFLIICLIFISTITCIGEIDVVKSYYLLKYEYKSFLDPLTDAGATEDELIDFFKDIELLLKSYEDLSETTIHSYLKESMVKVSTYRTHRNLVSVISDCYKEEIESYLDTGVVPPNFRDVYDAIIRSLFGNEDEDKTELVKKYETYLKFYNTNKNNYTSLSIQELEVSLESALSVLSDMSASQLEISKAVSALDSAYAALEEILPDDDEESGGGDTGGNSQGSATGGSQGTVGGGTVSVPIGSKTFLDVPQTYWGRPAILYLAEKNIVNGFTDGTFRPDELVTREQFAKMICETLKLSLSSELPVYSDVESGAWYEQYVFIIIQSGLMQGTGNQRFGIGDTLIRQDLAVIADRIIKQGFVNKTFGFSGQKVAFSDMDSVSDYAKSSVVQMQQYGIVNGTGENLFTPFGGVTRAQAAQIIYNLVK